MRRWLSILGIGALVGTVMIGTYLLRSPRAPVGLPRAVIEETTHDLGVLDPADDCKHLFVVRNEGSAPLTVVKAGTTCKCTVSMLPREAIPPGKGGPVEIGLKEEQKEDGPFRHTATFLTNDPNSPRIELTIEGEIRTYLAASPGSIHLTALDPGQPVEMSTLIYSQVVDDFSLASVETSIEGLTWEFEPVPREELEELDARSGYLATFHLSAQSAGSGFSGWVKAMAELTTTAANENGTVASSPTANRVRLDSTRTIRLQLSGRVPPIRTVYGREVDYKGVVSLGTLAKGKGTRVQLLLQVRGEHREIRVQEIERKPEFLKVSVEPNSPELAKKGLYNIIIEVPPDAPLCNHLTYSKMGEVRILTDHPEMPEIVRLKVAFVVMEPSLM
jgi:hypothetical protein